ncbi:glycosyl hydrolase [Kitasatospora sp. NPDC056531]|uniref:glycosyl hydrolase n=1 Tax=Kitasatospora sp. NPDC056531 TaxID=3345856 RepID=UPI003680B501
MRGRLRHRLAALGVAAAAVLGAVTTGPATATAATSTATADPNATPQAQAVLDWLTRLPDRGLRHKVASGFFAGYSGTDTPQSGKDFATQYQQVTDLYNRTGQFPTVLACDYAGGWTSDANPSPTEVGSSCDSALIDHWNAGGLVSVSVHLYNPVAGAAWRTPLPAATFQQLQDPGTAVGQAWRAELDKVAAGLQTLSDAGVPALFRPFHEMNGNWFWWGGQSPADFVTLWRSTYDYLTTTKGLHNLLWVYAPGCGQTDPTAYYAGHAYTDVVGLDCYSPTPGTITGYDRMTSLGKPFAFTEIGPPSGMNGTFDYGSWVAALHEQFPRTSYFLAWNGEWSPANNVNGSQLMNDPWVVDRGRVDLAAPKVEAPSVVYQDFESGTQGWTGYQVLHGPWQVTEWASHGSGSLKADVDLAGKPAFLNRVGPLDLSGDTTLSVTARTAPWGNQAGGSTAKLYVRTGASADSSSWAWIDCGATAANAKGIRLTLDLTKVADRAHVREIGVEFDPAPGASGQSAVYLDDVRLSGLLDGFESSTEGWTGSGTALLAGPWSVPGEGAGEGLRSLKADVDLAGGPVTLSRLAPADLTGATALTVDAGTAPWGDQGAGTTASLFVRTGTADDPATWTRYDSPAATVGPDGLPLLLDLTQVGDLAHIREIGVRFTPATGASGRSAVYVDNLVRWS